MMAQFYLPKDDTSKLERYELIEQYFHLGFTNIEILGFLSCFHSCTIGLRQLKRVLKRLGLRRRDGRQDIQTIINTIREELQKTGRDLGYRSMHGKLTKIHHIATDRETVRKILNFLDPDGVRIRRQRRLRRRQYFTRGPNDLWHIDGWDKLKEFGFCVHGCIDGYSRKILWLRAACTNNDPSIVCSYFSEALREMQGLPNVIRADRGTENVNIEQMQRFLRAANDDVRSRLDTTFLYGRSTSNQRIESWWSKFGSNGMNTWIDHFKQMAQFGIIDTSNSLDIDCCRFCYADLLHQELDEIRMLWNLHYIRDTRNQNSPPGKPDVLYHIPEMSGGVDCKQGMNEAERNAVSDILTNTPNSMRCMEHQELFQILMTEGNRSNAQSMDEAADNLVYLLDKIVEYLQ